MRFGKIASACAVLALFGSAQGFAADVQTEKAMKDFETRMVKPCEGKKSGDQVQVVSPRGATLMATCKMTAEINIK